METAVLALIAVGSIIGYLFLRKVFSEKAQVAAARARFLEAFGKFEKLADYYYTTDKQEYFFQEGLRLAHGVYDSGNPAVLYDILTSQVNKLLDSPSTHFKCRDNDPVDDSQ